MQNQKTIYLLLCVVGTVLPMSLFVPWLIDHGINLPVFFQELFATSIGGFFGLDVIVSAVALIFFVVFEGTRIGMKKQWIPIVATLTIGVSLGLPLFLFMRQIHIEKNHQPLHAD